MTTVTVNETRYTVDVSGAAPTVVTTSDPEVIEVEISAHPSLADHNTLGLATQDELDAHAATSHGTAHPDLAAHDTLGLATQAELDTHEADTTSVHGITNTEDLIRRAGALTAGSILFASGGNEAQQDNAGLFYDDTLNRLGIGKNSSLAAAVDIVVTAGVNTRESLLRGAVSDASADAGFAIGNATTVDGLFTPMFVGRNPVSTNSGMNFRATTTTAGDTGTQPILQFQLGRLDGDLLDGSLTALTARPLLRISNQNTSVMQVDVAGKIALGSGLTTASARLHVQSGSATEITQILQGAASQSANLTEWRDSAGAMMAQVTSAGKFQTISGSAASPGYSFSGNPTMGMYRAASGVIGFSVNSTEAIRLDATSGLTVQLGLKWGAAGLEQTTVGVAGAASALPSNPTRYLKVIGSGGEALVIPAYLAS